MNDDKGKRLKTVRKAAGLSQQQLGERLGVDQAFLSRVENGANEGTVSFWCEAARVLGVSLDYLLDLPPLQAPAPTSEPQRLNRIAILSDYTLAEGLRKLAMDEGLTAALAITDDEWTQLGVLAATLPPQVSKDGYLQLLVTLRGVCRGL